MANASTWKWQTIEKFDPIHERWHGFRIASTTTTIRCRFKCWWRNWLWTNVSLQFNAGSRSINGSNCWKCIRNEITSQISWSNKNFDIVLGWGSSWEQWNTARHIWASEVDRTRCFIVSTCAGGHPWRIRCGNKWTRCNCFASMCCRYLRFINIWEKEIEIENINILGATHCYRQWNSNRSRH